MAASASFSEEWSEDEKWCGVVLEDDSGNGVAKLKKHGRLSRVTPRVFAKYRKQFASGPPEHLFRSARATLDKLCHGVCGQAGVLFTHLQTLRVIFLSRRDAYRQLICDLLSTPNAFELLDDALTSSLPKYKEMALRRLLGGHFPSMRAFFNFFAREEKCDTDFWISVLRGVDKVPNLFLEHVVPAGLMADAKFYREVCLRCAEPPVPEELEKRTESAEMRKVLFEDKRAAAVLVARSPLWRSVFGRTALAADVFFLNSVQAVCTSPDVDTPLRAWGKVIEASTFHCSTCFMQSYVETSRNIEEQYHPKKIGEEEDDPSAKRKRSVLLGDETRGTLPEYDYLDNLLQCRAQGQEQ